MLKRHTFWLWLAAVFQILTAAVHSLSFFGNPVGRDETERQLIDLMTTYHRDLGGGFQPTTMELFIALSSCFALMYLFGGLVNVYLLRKKAPVGILKGILLINVVLFGACFVIMAFLTFTPPIILTGLVFGFLGAAYLTFPRGPIEQA